MITTVLIREKTSHKDLCEKISNGLWFLLIELLVLVAKWTSDIILLDQS